MPKLSRSEIEAYQNKGYVIPNYTISEKMLRALKQALEETLEINSNIGLQSGDFLLSLISFNVGVELGQIAVIAAAFTLRLCLPLSPDRYRRIIAIPASCLIGATGIWIVTKRVSAILLA